MIVGDTMKCERCGNKEPHYFFKDGSIWYCRKCISFGRMDVGQPLIKAKLKRNLHNCRYVLDYPLTIHQQQVVNQLSKHLENKRNVLVYAACGAGKTEIVMQSIEDYLNRGLKVGIAISRRQVVLEIRDRMEAAFPMLDVIAVCEGHTNKTDGDIIVCTMHQLHRYHQAFDLLILDEIDAFPFAGNAMLESIAKHACVGENIYLSATPSTSMLESANKKEIEILTLFVRPHGHPLVVPNVKRSIHHWIYVQLVLELHKQRKKHNQVLLFVPTIKLANQLYAWLKYLFSSIVFTSKSEDKESKIKDFRNKKAMCMICTTVLERGITIEGVQVFVLFSEHFVFSQASLIQMIGRVGRKMNNPTGDAIMFCHKQSKEMKQCIHSIQTMNEAIKHGEM